MSCTLNKAIWRDRLNCLRALGILERAHDHIESQYSPRLSRTDAIDHFQTRTLLLRVRILLHNDTVKRFPDLDSEPITQAEVNAAVQTRTNKLELVKS